MSYYRNQLEAWLKTISVKADKVIDIGGGANPVENRTRSWNVGEYYIWDNNAEGYFTKNKYDLNISYDNVEQALPMNDDDKFDIVFCLEVFEYIYDPMSAMKNIYVWLKKGGVAYISFPAIYPVHNPQEIDYLRYTKRGIEKLLEKSNFKSWEIDSRVATMGKEALANFYSNEGMHPVKNDPVIFDIGYMVEAYK